MWYASCARCSRSSCDVVLTVYTLYFALQDQKLVVEMVELFAITDIDAQAVRAAAQSLLASKKYTALIKLLTIFSSVGWSFESTIKTMAKSKDWSPAELLAKTFGGPGRSNGLGSAYCV